MLVLLTCLLKVVVDAAGKVHNEVTGFQADGTTPDGMNVGLNLPQGTLGEAERLQNRKSI